MNKTIFLAVAVGSLTVLVAGLAGHLASTKGWHKWVFWGAGLLTLILIYFQARSVKDPPSADEIAKAVKKELDKKEPVNITPTPTPVAMVKATPTPTPKVSPTASPPRSPEEDKAQAALPNAVLSLTQKPLISTRPDAPIETEVTLQTAEEMPSLNLILQCDQALVDANASTVRGGAKFNVRWGIPVEHPNVFVYSYGGAMPPFGPSNPLIVNVWTKEAVKCQAATY